MIYGYGLDVFNVLLQLLCEATRVWVFKLSVLVGIFFNVEVSQDVVVYMASNFIAE